MAASGTVEVEIKLDADERQKLDAWLAELAAFHRDVKQLRELTRYVDQHAARLTERSYELLGIRYVKAKKRRTE